MRGRGGEGREGGYRMTGAGVDRGPGETIPSRITTQLITAYHILGSTFSASPK